jgi:hypothetical protein
VALLVTHEYLRTKEHNDSTSFYLIDLYRRYEGASRLFLNLTGKRYYKTLPCDSHALPRIEFYLRKGVCYPIYKIRCEIADKLYGVTSN